MRHRHIIEAQQFNKKGLQEILSAADHIKERTERKLPLDLLRGKILANLFYVASMRTNLSFDCAMKRLGGDVTHIDFPESFSSELTGGSFEDTVQVVSSLVDLIVLRHYEGGSAKRAAEISAVPIINGGDGPAQHPTQALIDLYCIESSKVGLTAFPSRLSVTWPTAARFGPWSIFWQNTRELKSILPLRRY
jgi:aspartate carbamoyltransferase catalytic subunit